jgi:phage baseplate assembly protein W
VREDKVAENLLPFKLQRQQATFIDLNPQIGQNQYGELLIDEVAIIKGSLENLLRCPIGDRSRIFQPEYGTMVYDILQEPLDEITAFRLRAVLIQGLQRWEPRVEIQQNGTVVTTDYSIPGYVVRIAATMKITNTRFSAEFGLTVV